MPVLAPSHLPKDTTNMVSGHGGPGSSVTTNSMLNHHHNLNNHNNNHLNLPHHDDLWDGKQAACHMSRYRALNCHTPSPPSSPRNNNFTSNHNTNVKKRVWPSPPSSSLRGYPIQLGIDLHGGEIASENPIITPTKKRKHQAAIPTATTPLTPSDNEIKRSCHALQALMVEAGLIQKQDNTPMPKRIRQSESLNQTALLSPFQYDSDRNRNSSTDSYLRSYVHPSRNGCCWKDDGMHDPMSDELTDYDVVRVNSSKRAWIESFDEDDEMEAVPGKRVWSHGSEITIHYSHQNEECSLSPIMTTSRGGICQSPQSPYAECTSSKKRRVREKDIYSTPPRQCKPSHILPEHLPWGLEREDFIISIADGLDHEDNPSFSSTSSPIISIRKAPADSPSQFDADTKVWPAHVNMELDAPETVNTTIAPLVQTTTTHCAQSAEECESALGKKYVMDFVDGDDDVRELSFLNDEEVGKISQHRELSFTYDGDWKNNKETGMDKVGAEKRPSRGNGLKVAVDNKKEESLRGNKALDSPVFLGFSF